MSTLTEDMINCLLLSKSEREDHWSQAQGTTHPSPSFFASSLWPDAGPGSSSFFTALCPSKSPTRTFLITAGPQPPFLPPRSIAGPSARVGGSQQRFPGIMAVICQHEIGLPFLCPPKGREEVQLLERQGHRKARVGEGSCPPSPEGNLPGRQFVPSFLIMPPIFSVW